MSKSSSFQRLPVEVEPFRLVEQDRIFDGRIPISDFPRLKELAFQDNKNDNTQDDLSAVVVHIEFTRTNTGLPIVNGEIHIELQLICQRCLEAKSESFKSSFEVVLVKNDEQAEKLQEGFDTWFVEDQKMFLLDFIEDEILLGLPLAILHDDCEPARALIEALPEDVASEEQEESKKDNPFSVLKNLKLDR